MNRPWTRKLEDRIVEISRLADPGTTMVADMRERALRELIEQERAECKFAGIQVDPAHLSALLIYAFRYCLGRKSYAPSEMCEILRAYGKHLEPFERKLIAREIRTHLSRQTADHYASGWQDMAERLEDA